MYSDFNIDENLVKLASETEIAEVVGKFKASIIYAHFHPKMEPWELNIL